MSGRTDLELKIRGQATCAVEALVLGYVILATDDDGHALVQLPTPWQRNVSISMRDSMRPWMLVIASAGQTSRQRVQPTLPLEEWAQRSVLTWK